MFPWVVALSPSSVDEQRSQAYPSYLIKKISIQTGEIIGRCTHTKTSFSLLSSIASSVCMRVGKYGPIIPPTLPTVLLPTSSMDGAYIGAVHPHPFPVSPSQHFFA